MGNTDPPADNEKTTIQLSTTNRRRLEKRANDLGADTYNEVLNHLLAETQEEITLEDAVERGIEYYGGLENIACIHAEHTPTRTDTDPSFIDITFYTGEAESIEETLDVVSSHHRVVIESEGDGEPLSLEVILRGTIDGPSSWDRPDGTLLYMSDTVVGAAPYPLEKGLDRAKRKLRGEDVEYDKETTAPPDAGEPQTPADVMGDDSDD